MEWNGHEHCSLFPFSSLFSRRSHSLPPLDDNQGFSFVLLPLPFICFCFFSPLTILPLGFSPIYPLRHLPKGNPCRYPQPRHSSLSKPYLFISFSAFHPLHSPPSLKPLHLHPHHQPFFTFHQCG